MDPETVMRTKKATFRMKTTRSLDEGKSQYLTCVECGRKWKSA
jgi:DNA-directed RNA polymerase subunit M/transcription elongation factor TFIIS